MSVVIRKLGTEAEARDCAGIMSSSEPWITLGRGFEDCLNLVRDPDREVYVALSDRETAGFIILEMGGPFAGYIRSIALSERWRNQGVGRELIAFAENRIFKTHPNVFLCVSSFNERARKLYERLGYEKIGELRDYIVQGHSEILMRKTIGPIANFERQEES